MSTIIAERNRIVLIIVAFNLLCAAVVFIYGIFQKPGRRVTVWMQAILIFLCPPVMALYVAFSRIIDRFMMQSKVDMNDISFNKNREKTVLQPDNEAEMNYVSIHDAVRLSDRNQLRHLLIDVLKYKQGSNLSSLYEAMNVKDTEASHYAASAIQEALSEFRIRVQNMVTQLQKRPDDAKLNIEALSYLYKELKQGILIGSELQTFVFTANSIAENLYMHNTWFMLAEHYSWIVELLISIDALEMAETWAMRAKQNRGDDLWTYKTLLRLYFAQGNGPAFIACLNEFKHSQVRADREMLNLIRLYR